MTVYCEYTSPSSAAFVNYHYDAHSMTVLRADDRLVTEFIAQGGSIGPYAPPPAPPSIDQIDLAALNAALTEPGSVVRALGLIVFDMATGKIPVNPNYTMAQFVNLLKAKMRA